MAIQNLRCIENVQEFDLQIENHGSEAIIVINRHGGIDSIVEGVLTHQERGITTALSLPVPRREHMHAGYGMVKAQRYKSQ